jgi:hypothetical protein
MHGPDDDARSLEEPRLDRAQGRRVEGEVGPVGKLQFQRMIDGIPFYRSLYGIILIY